MKQLARKPSFERFTAVVVVAVLLLAIVGLASAFIAHARQPAADRSSPVGTLTAYVVAIQTGHPDDAWDLLAPEALRESVPEKSDFRRTVLAAGPANSRVRILSHSESGDTAEINIEVAALTANLIGNVSSHELFVRLDRSSGRWLLTAAPPPWEFRT
jgi:hypothetical protein